LIIDETIDSSQNLANAIFKLLSDKNLQNQMKQNLSEIAFSQIAAYNIAKEIIMVIDKRKL